MIWIQGNVSLAFFFMSLVTLTLAEGRSGISNCNLWRQLCSWGSLGACARLCWPQIFWFVFDPPLRGSSHLGSYWMHFPLSQLQIPVSFANIGAHAKFIVLAKLLQISWSFTKPVTRLWPIKLTSKCSCLAKGMEAPGIRSESLWEVESSLLAVFSVGWSQTASKLTLHSTKQR